MRVISLRIVKILSLPAKHFLIPLHGHYLEVRAVVVVAVATLWEAIVPVTHANIISMTRAGSIFVIMIMLAGEAGSLNHIQLILSSNKFSCSHAFPSTSDIPQNLPTCIANST